MMRRLISSYGFRMPSNLRPSDVFTPNRFPLEEQNAYVFRADAERELKRARSRNETPIVYGEYGVGKTTLIKRFFQDADREGRLVHVLTPAGLNFGDVATIVLERLGYRVQVSEEVGRVRSVEGSADVRFIGAIRAKLGGAVLSSKTTTSELVVKSPTEHGLLQVMAESEVVLAIDEMHKASDGFRLQLAEFIKAVSNRGLGYPQIIVLGTTTDAARLVERDQGIDRLLREIRVQPMTDEEAAFVVTYGMQKLDISVSEPIVTRIVRTAAGAPALLQEICLDVAEQIVSKAGSTIDHADVDMAIKEFLIRSQARLTATYMKAIETTGRRRYRKQILRAMAESASDFVTMEELTERITGYVGQSVVATALSGPLRQLKEPEYGQILSDVARPTGDARVFNLTCFNDARMKAFIRVMHAVEEAGLLPAGGAAAELLAGRE